MKEIFELLKQVFKQRIYPCGAQQSEDEGRRRESKLPSS